MSFASEFNQLDLTGLSAQADCATAVDVERALAQSGTRQSRLEDFAALISSVAAQPEYLEEIAQRAQALTIKHFGRVIRLFAPLYLSNECINVCKYCGFSRDNPILRVTLTPQQIEAEAQFLHNQGFRHLLLVAGEHPHFVSRNYLRDCVARLHPQWPSISLEVGPLAADEYRPIVEAGAEGLVLYQETYNHAVYDQMHVSGPKRDFHSRLDTPEQAYVAGFKRLGIGALLGLAPWRQEAIAVAAHAGYLLKHCWKAQLTVSIPRLRPAAGEFAPLEQVSNRDLAQFVCALRLTYPEIGLVLSTREPAQLRDGLFRLGITLISAGSHTEPGGYTGQGKDKLHLTKGGHMIKSEGEFATEQFAISDNRSPDEVATTLSAIGYEPVWKDWEAALNAQ